MTHDAHPTRRNVVAATALGAVAATALTACGGDDESAPPATTPATAPTAGAGGDRGDRGTIAKLADVPVGGAVSAQTPEGLAVIVARPDAGRVVAFDARCTHQGCTVAPKGERLLCPCHQSAFEALTGKVLTGPATADLASVPVSVDGENVVAG